MKKVLIALCSFLFVCIIVFPFIHNVPLTPFHPDENYWILESKYYKLLIFDKQPLWKFSRDPNSDRWILMTLCDQPCVAKIIFITVSNIFCYDMGMINLSRWYFTRDVQYNMSRNTVPHKNVLHFYRYIVSSFAILGCIIVFFIGMKVSHVCTGILAAVSMAYSPLMILCSTRAMADGILIFFLVLSVYAMIIFLTYLLKDRYDTALLSSFMVGIAGGLATGTKLNGGISIITFMALCSVLFVIGLGRVLKNKGYMFKNIFRDRSMRIIVLAMFLAAITAFSVFILVDPFLHDMPIQKSMIMIDSRIEAIQYQRATFGATLNNFMERIVYVWKIFFSESGTYAPFKNRFHIPTFFILFLAGISLMVNDEFRYMAKNGRCSFRLLILIWFFTTLAVLLCALSIGWDRYVLPLLPPLSLLFGYSIEGLLRRVLKMRHRRII